MSFAVIDHFLVHCGRTGEPSEVIGVTQCLIYVSTWSDQYQGSKYMHMKLPRDPSEVVIWQCSQESSVGIHPGSPRHLLDILRRRSVGYSEEVRGIGVGWIDDIVQHGGWRLRCVGGSFVDLDIRIHIQGIPLFLLLLHPRDLRMFDRGTRKGGLEGVRARAMNGVPGVR